MGHNRLFLRQEVRQDHGQRGADVGDYSGVAERNSDPRRRVGADPCRRVPELSKGG